MELFFRKVGNEQGTKHLVILHGVFGFGENWLTVAKLFNPEYCVWLVDQRNHGRSPHAEEFNYSVLAQDVLTFFQQNGIEKPVLLGHSMGGKTAMEVAKLAGEKLAALVIVDIGPKAYDIRHADLLDALAELPFDTAKTRSELENQLAVKIPEADVRLFLMKNLYRDENNQFKMRLNYKVLREKLNEVGKALQTERTITLPTLFIRGGKSKYILNEDWPSIEQIFTNAELETVPNAGHWVHAEAPEPFAIILNEFLLRLNQ